MKSDLGDVLTALDLSTKTFRRIRLNYLWAFGYNCLMIPLAAGALYPPTRWQMPPWVAGAHRRVIADPGGMCMRDVLWSKLRDTLTELILAHSSSSVAFAVAVCAGFCVLTGCLQPAAGVVAAP